MKVLLKIGRIFAPSTLPSGGKDTRGVKITFNSNSADLLKLHLEKVGHEVEYQTSRELPARAIHVFIRNRMVAETTYREIRKPCEVERLLEVVARKSKSGRTKRCASSKNAKKHTPEIEEETQKRGERAEAAEAVQPQNSVEVDEAHQLHILACFMDQLVLEGSTYLRNAADSLRLASKQFAMVDSPLKEVVDNMAVALERQALALATVHQSAAHVLTSLKLAQPPARHCEGDDIKRKKSTEKELPDSRKSKESSRKKRPASAPVQRVQSDGASSVGRSRGKHLGATSKSCKRRPIWRPTSVDKGIPSLK
uniref:Uncharacterized protein n=1 Tax=Pyramimonas obovata TaxID=1411642 RepID=A0A7S0R5J1_9CHLO|mmetsp:Transcript_26089/g.56574  ORF Transcript_26089/g.56574 Transcript_26089/m.56574 type:complete len:310 (+) Transcript_26089:244-1173(+)|eukprot:CAMPEP_0118949230 /NCGR_PEP_ID=MMETSP1169-20130426/49255_1 /TAXON_ID=36882 /ORGANISM="Pyramimonas obovata, Strain CCMP722" /LENGTH=309 /DNA_ID=CAMNT_0006895817 /DNA_START=204 /DNA_END=1133 /DNA_ORIENTATION=+